MHAFRRNCKSMQIVAQLVVALAQLVVAGHWLCMLT